MPRSQVRILRYQNWSIDIQTCEQIDYSSNLSDRSYCLWANRNFPLLVRREIRTHQLQSTSFPPPPSLSSFISPRSSLAALCVNFARSHPERDADTNMEKSLTFQLLVILKRGNVSPEFVKLHRLRAFYSELNSMACLNLTEKIVNIVVTEVVLAF